MNIMETKSCVIMLTPAMSKRLIALGICQQDCLKERLKKGIVVINAGTTNGYVAEAVLESLGYDIGPLKSRMIRGVILPPDSKVEKAENADIVIIDGKWEKDLTFEDVLDRISAGDIIIKGGNAVNPRTGDVGVLIGHPQGGTVGRVIRAAYGRRARILAPVGLEKRVDAPITDIMELINDPEATGLRMGHLPGKAYTEIEAISDLTCADAVLVGGGGVMGAEGTCIFHVMGAPEDIEAVKELYAQLRKVENYSQN